MITDVEQERLSEGEVGEIMVQLDRILKSTFFQGSQRCSRFLQYSVENVLSGSSQQNLKERIIGMEVFGRSADYDTQQDSTVRVTANEVRKRLAQYYGKSDGNETPVIELPAGSYATIFHWKPRAQVAGDIDHNEKPVAAILPAAPDFAETKEVEPNRRWRRNLWLGVAGVAVMLLIGIIVSVSFVFRKPDPRTAVWESTLRSRNAVTICVAEPTVYRPAFEEQHSNRPDGQMVALPDAVVGVGDAFALADVTGFLSSEHKPWYLLPSTNTSFRDLNKGPTILIGSFSNPWTRKLLSDLRFVFVEGPPNKLIDRGHPERGWTIKVSENWTAQEDYAVISRFQSPDTGETIISLAGATNFGTEAAGKFLVNSDLLEAALRNAPKNWKNKNFQIVLHLKVQGNAPEQPTVVDEYFW